MNDLLVRSVQIDWSKLPQESYLRNIPALRSLTELKLEAPVTYFVGENGSGCFPNCFPQRATARWGPPDFIHAPPE